jgi:hypothetical protein
VIEDVTQHMRDNYTRVMPRVKEIIDTINRDKVPDIDIGPYCHDPNECPFTGHCWKNIPEPSIFNLPGIKDRKWELYHQGIISLDDPRLTDLTEIQQRMVDVYQSGERYVDHESIHAEISQWQYPLIFLDFETINPGIPRYDGCGPYQQVPFQFSAHILTAPDAELIHHEFLFTSASDPRPTIIPALLNACGTEGSIVAYYGKFEASRIKELAEFSPADSEALLALCERIVDPLPIFRAAVYDNKFCGSFSLKYVAPALLGAEQSYEGMAVANGGDAQRAFEEMITPGIDPGRHAALTEALLAYCEKDTMVMVDLTRWMLAQGG